MQENPLLKTREKQENMKSADAVQHRMMFIWRGYSSDGLFTAQTSV
jgi:hypothetical protein